MDLNNRKIMHSSVGIYQGHGVPDSAAGLIASEPLQQVLLPMITFLYKSSSSVSLPCFNLSVLMPKCLGQRSCISFTFPVAVVEGTHFWRNEMVLTLAEATFLET